MIILPPLAICYVVVEYDLPSQDGSFTNNSSPNAIYSLSTLQGHFHSLCCIAYKAQTTFCNRTDNWLSSTWSD